MGGSDPGPCGACGVCADLPQPQTNTQSELGEYHLSTVAYAGYMRGARDISAARIALGQLIVRLDDSIVLAMSKRNNNNKHII